jgi:hypothetical protein
MSRLQAEETQSDYYPEGNGNPYDNWDGKEDEAVQTARLPLQSTMVLSLALPSLLFGRHKERVHAVSY